MISTPDYFWMLSSRKLDHIDSLIKPIKVFSAYDLKLGVPFLIKDGFIEVSRKDKSGSRIKVGDLRGGDIFGFRDGRPGLPIFDLKLSSEDLRVVPLDYKESLISADLFKAYNNLKIEWPFELCLFTGIEARLSRFLLTIAAKTGRPKMGTANIIFNLRLSHDKLAARLLTRRSYIRSAIGYLKEYNLIGVNQSKHQYLIKDLDGLRWLAGQGEKSWNFLQK